METGRLLSVNAGEPRAVRHGEREVRTSIWKDPVAGRVAARADGLDGNRQVADPRARDKALYAYAREDYDWWEERLGRELAPGTFGENLTIEGIDVTGARIGERWEVGGALVEVTEPRLPCFKLGIRMDDPRFVKRFGGAGRPGAYLRVLREGDVGAGDPVRVVRRPRSGPTIGGVYDARMRAGG